MNKKIAEAVAFINESGLKKAILAIPFSVSASDLKALREMSICAGVVLRNPPQEFLAAPTDGWIGRFENLGWRLPATRAPIVFVGTHLMLTRRMAITAIKTGRLSIAFKINGSYRKLALYRLLLWRTGDKVLRVTHRQSPSHGLRRMVEIARQVPLLRTLWIALFRRKELSPSFNLLSTSARNNPGLSGEALYHELLRRARACAKLDNFQPVLRRVILVNAGLAAGGAERQIVNTLIGLQAAGQCESVSLLAEYIDHAPHLDFFLHELEAAGIDVNQVEQAISLTEDGLSSVAPEVADLLACLPPELIEEILNLVEEFRVRRPEVVHAWQDATSIKVGIAAVIAGVPRIVLASRNVTPINFIYYQDYMRPAYRALAELENVKFINNSEAGAHDYTRWLGLPEERFNVVRNGVDLTCLRRSTAEEIDSYRRTLGIPKSARVLGSVFRFYVEKRPMLWLEAALQIASQFSDVHFLIIGDGLLRPQMEKFIRQSGLSDRVHLPGTRPDVAPALSAMDIFLLTSEFEGTPNVVLEAQWLGLSIVATESGGTRESFVDGGTGLLATKAEPEEIARLVGTLLTDQSLMNFCARKGRGFVANEFGVDRMIQQTLNVYGLGDSYAHSVGFKRSDNVEAT